MKTALETVQYGLKKPIAMVGLMGVGKTRLGGELAKRLNIKFVDNDREVEEAARCSVSDIFANFGEEAFRDGEKRVLRRLIEVDKTPKVIATGGGAIVTPETVERLRMRTHCIWLQASIDTLIERTSRNNRRPLLHNADPRKIFEDLIEKRTSLYEASSHIQVHVDNKSINQTMDAILEALAQEITESETAS